MKLSAVFLFAVSLQVSARTDGQTVTLDLTNVPVQKVFKEASRQTGISIIYNEALFNGLSPVTIKVRDATIQQVLDLCLRDQPFTYSFEGKLFQINKKPAPANGSVIGTNSPASPPINIHGRVVDSAGKPVAGATIIVKGSNAGIATDANGEFALKNVERNATIIISSVGFERKEIKINGKTEFSIQLMVTASQLINVQVTYSNGYERINPERATGSYASVNNELINRRVSPDILSRIEDMTTGVSFNNASDGILIRGRNSIFSNVSPLIVVDNFPYDGDINNVNPNDVENITILKDAAAASIWGARAGNGVIVITTKKGKNVKPQVSFNSNITVQGKPDLFGMRTISSADEISVEEFLFSKGRYNSLPNNILHPGLTPVQEILFQQRSGAITPGEAGTEIAALATHDVRNDLLKYLYRTAVNQQYSLNVSGNTPSVSYYMSAGWDHGVPNLVGRHSDRVTLRTQNDFRVTNRLHITAGINYVQNNSKSGNNPGYNIQGMGHSLYPYAQLADANGNPLPVDLYFRGAYTDTAGGGNLLDWKYKPLADISTTQNSIATHDIVLNTGISYRLSNFISAEIRYQFETSTTASNSLKTDSSYYTRNLVNTYYQPGAAIAFPVPAGGIMDISSTQLISQQGRAQLNYSQTFREKHTITAIAGWEIKNLATTGNGYRLYGYNPTGNLTYPYMDFVTLFPQYQFGRLSSIFTATIPNNQFLQSTLDRFISYFADAAYTYDGRYTLSASGRNDAANLFGVSTNQKGVPLWSAGASWQINKERFYHVSWLPNLRVRATYGHNGNFSRLASAYTTITYGTSLLGLTTATIQNPPNKDLKWEQDQVINLGLDFGLRNNRIAGSIEYYAKYNKDLVAQAPVDPTLGVLTGLSSFDFGNVASTKGHGMDLELNFRNMDGRNFKWTTTFLFSHVLITVDKYLLPVPTAATDYTLGSGTINPIKGKPVYSMYSYAWAGLDPATGDPRGYLGKSASSDWYNIVNNTNPDSLIYNGPVQPTSFGAFRNTFTWKNLSLSVNINFKLGYYFRRPSINYASLYSTWTGSSDFSKRWQTPGDEKTTNVPSMVYPNNSNRDQFYQYSSVLVDKGDHIRLQDITFSYDLNKTDWKTMPFQSVRLYAYASNLGIIWKANKDGLDPYYSGAGFPDPGKSIAIGLNINF